MHNQIILPIKTPPIKLPTSIIKNLQELPKPLYIDKYHKKYCKTANIQDLHKSDIPFIETDITVNFPILFIKDLNTSTANHNFNIDSLNNIPKFDYHYVKGMELKYNTFSKQNILIKGTFPEFNNFDDYIDMNWLNAMNQYIKNLSNKDLFTMLGYTLNGDKIANQYLRNMMTSKKFNDFINPSDKWTYGYFPLFFQAIQKIQNSEIVDILKNNNSIQFKKYMTPRFLKKKTVSAKELCDYLKQDKYDNSTKYLILYHLRSSFKYESFWKPVISMYITNLQNIINNSPPTEKVMYLYRGVKSDYYLQGKKKNLYKTDSFISTSLNITSALFFAQDNCCFKRITVLPGTRCLLMSGVSKFDYEIEILLGYTTNFYISKDITYISTDTKSTCHSNNEIQVSNVILIN